MRLIDVDELLADLGISSESCAKCPQYDKCHADSPEYTIKDICVMLDDAEWIDSSKLSSADMSYCETAFDNGYQKAKEDLIKILRSHDCEHCSLYENNKNCTVCAIGYLIETTEGL